MGRLRADVSGMANPLHAVVARVEVEADKHTTFPLVRTRVPDQHSAAIPWRRLYRLPHGGAFPVASGDDANFRPQLRVAARFQ